jgi:geranylgeranyl pyrophosphate synthase
MRLALSGKQISERPDPLVSRWAHLPGLCCQAAGGEAEWAEDVTLAWLLFYAAADLMDSVQDNDEPDEWWREKGPGAALATASGLYFSGSCALNQLHLGAETSRVAPAVITDFYNTFLIMTSGQYRDLNTETPSLEAYWQLAEAKSGAFFGLACRAGARLASADPTVWRAYGDYGLHLGLLIQVMDDLDDVRHLRGLLPAWLKSKIRASLPYIYASEMNTAPTRERLAACLAVADQNQQALDELVAILDASGAALYVGAELEHHRRFALKALERAAPTSSLYETLANIIHDL